ncbi:hypothetical protein D3C79_477860 [compost metagenome]
MFRRNAEAIQGAPYPCVESFFDLVELNFYLAAYAVHFFTDFVKLVVGGIELFVDALLAARLDTFTRPDQLFEVVRAFLTDAGVGADTGQPDLARIAAHLAKRAQGFVFFLHNHFGHAVYLMLMSGGKPPMEAGLEHKVGKKIRNLTLRSSLSHLYTASPVDHSASVAGFTSRTSTP